MKARYFIAMTVALSVSAVAFAAEGGEALFQKNNCVACHAVANKSVGPSLKDIAAKYKGDKGAQARLEAKVRSGGKDSFGTMPMPATAKSVSDGDIKTMVTWILSQKYNLTFAQIGRLAPAYLLPAMQGDFSACCYNL